MFIFKETFVCLKRAGGSNSCDCFLLCQRIRFYSNLMASALDRAKRVLVTLLKSLATAYGLVLTLTRDSSDKDVRTAYRKVSLETHPDRGGGAEDQ